MFVIGTLKNVEFCYPMPATRCPLCKMKISALYLKHSGPIDLTQMLKWGQKATGARDGEGVCKIVELAVRQVFVLKNSTYPKNKLK